MGTTTMKFTRDGYNYNDYATQEQGDEISFETTQAPSFPSGQKATSVSFYIAKGLKSGSGSARSCKIRIDFRCNGSWCAVWSGEKYLSGTGGDGTVEAFNISIPSGYQRNFATYGVSEVRIVQDGSYSIKGTSDATGTATFTYDTYYGRCSAPSKVTVGASSTSSSKVSLSWEGAKAGTNTSINGYLVEYADSSDNSKWGDWVALDTYTKSPQNVKTPAVGKYRKYRVWTLGAVNGSANSSYDSSSAKESSDSVLKLQTVTRCTEPTTVTVEKTITAAAENKLLWEGAKGGTNNSISGYFIQYTDSADGTTWNGTWGGDITVGVVNEYPVPMPAENVYRKFRVYTLGNAGSNYRSLNPKESNVTFRGHAEIEGFTDSPLVVGETHVKALHMQELQDRANTLRDFYRLPAYNFTSITAGVTGLKDWTAHVNEIRAAVDEITTDHAAWIAIPVNCPRADVIEQLRAVILAI